MLFGRLSFNITIIVVDRMLMIKIHITARKDGVTQHNTTQQEGKATQHDSTKAVIFSKKLTASGEIQTHNASCKLSTKEKALIRQEAIVHDHSTHS